MSSGDGAEPSRSQSPTDTHPLPGTPDPASRPEDPTPDNPTPWGWSSAGPSWGDPDQPAWTQGVGPSDAGAQPTQPVWGQGGGSWGASPTGPAWGERPPAADRPPRRNRLLLGLAAGAVAIVLAAGSYGVGQAVGRNASDGVPTAAGAGVPTPAVSAPVKGGSEPVAAVAKALLPSIVEISTGQGLGSGVIYDRNGYILTAAHVVDGSSQVTVRLANGDQVNGRVVGTDDGNDVGVVKVDRGNLKAAPLALGVDIQVGQTAVAIGSPFGLDQTVTAGVVSATSRAIEAQTAAGGGRTVREVLQTDAPINPGNSGGALADRLGRVIGINDAIESATGENSGIGFAIPIDIAARSAAAIVKGQQIRTAYLGVSTEDSTTSQAGALIRQVVGGGPAAKAGIRVGDLVVALNGQPVQGSTDLAGRVRALTPGQQVQVKLIRDGKEQTVTATLGENPNG